MSRLPTLVLAALALPALAQAQDFHPTLVDVPEEITGVVGRSFLANRDERLWCVIKHNVTEEKGYTLVHVTKVEEANISGRRANAGDITTECIGPDGKPQPTLHTHPGGTCQASPDDYDAIINRGAPFDGIVCGEKAVVWYFSGTLLNASLYLKFCVNKE